MRRRDILQRGGLFLTAGLTASAGCLDNIPSIDSEGSSSPDNGQPTPTPDNGQPTPTPDSRQPTPTPDSEPPSYTQWVPDFSDAESMKPAFSLDVVDLLSFRQYRTYLSDSLSTYSYLGLSNMDGITMKKSISIFFGSGHGMSIVLGDYDRSAVVSTLLNNGYTKDSSYHGYTLLQEATSKLPSKAGIGDTAVMHSTKGQYPHITNIIDAKRKRITRSVVRNKAFAKLTKHLGDGDYVWIGHPQFEFLKGFSGAGMEGSSVDGYQLGGKIQLNGKKSRLTIVFLNYEQNPVNKPSIEPILRSKLQKALDVNDSLRTKWTGDVLRAEMDVSTKKITSKFYSIIAS